MMKAQELRISNYFEYRIQDKLDERKDWWEVSQIDVNDLVILDSNIDYDYRPIKLTEEWLVKFGFEETDNYGDQIYYEPKNRRNRNYYICFDHDDISFGLVVFGSCTSLIYDETILQYVHQLQNLYFALTGTELTIKP